MVAVASKDFQSNNGTITSLSKLKLVPPPEQQFSGLLPPDFRVETRDDKEQSLLSRSDRHPKRDIESIEGAPKITNRRGQGKLTATDTEKRQSRCDNSCSTSRGERTQSKTRRSSLSNSRERSQIFSPSYNEKIGCKNGAFDQSPLVVGCHNGDLPASAMSELLDSKSSVINAQVNNGNLKKLTTTKRITKKETNSKAKVTIVGAAKVYTRSLIPPKVYHSSATGLWISTINTASSSDDVKAFSFRTEQEARASAYANAPPVMIPFDDVTHCMLCDNKYSLLRRRRHCLNCGICVCTNFSCSTHWRAKMIPETYNIKGTNTVKVCTSCDTLAKRFQHSLLEGRYETALELFLTGNINLRVPFAFKSEKEDMLPVHCAIKGKSEKLLRWLVETQCCPLQMFATSNKGSRSFKSNENENYLPSFKTSKGKSIVDLAMESKHSGILRFLVKEKGLSVFEVKDLNVVLGAMDSLIKEEESQVHNSAESKDVDGTAKESKVDATESSSGKKKSINEEKTTTNVFIHKPETSISVAEKVKGFSKIANNSTFKYNNDDSDEEEDICFLDDKDENSVCTTLPDVCIICSEKKIDCVAAPCGHQVCCMKCSNWLHSCPVCSTSCRFISIYQP